MKRKFKIVMGLVLFVAVAYLYAHIDKTTIIYNESMDSSQYQTTGILDNKTVEQIFLSQEEMLDGVRVKCGVHGDITGIQLKFSLIDMKTQKVEAESIADATVIKNSKFFDLRFNQINGCKGKLYKVVIEEVGTTTNNGVSIFFAEGTEKDTKLVIGKESVDGTLILKTLSHRFDMETFIVVLCFTLYIFLFLKFLYKLFK
ncbi:MAG: hypothetical protein RR869_04710 [Lachnospiraceae bacterium]